MGKTFTAANIAKEFKNTLWLTHSEELIEQSAAALIREYIGIDVAEVEEHDGVLSIIKSNRGLFGNKEVARVKQTMGIIKRDLFEIDRPITVASIQTLHRRLDWIDPKHFECIIIDEAHMAAANTWTKAIEHFSPKLRLGLTATPDRLDGASLTDLFSEVIVNYDIKYGVENGYLCELDGIKIKTGVNLESVHTQAGDFNQKELQAAVDTDERNELIVKKWYEHTKGERPTLVFAVNVSHAQRLAEQYNIAGHKATFVVADESLCPDRKERINDFKNGNTLVLTNVNILTTGFDHPDTGCIVMARPTKSRTLYLQSVGRGTRLKTPYLPYNNCMLLDVVDNSGRHSLINAETLDHGKRIEDRVFMLKETKAKLIENRDRVTKMREMERDQRVNLLKLPEIKIYDTYKTREAATEKQLEWLKREGYDIVNNHWTKGQAMSVISNLPAAQKDLEKLKKLGYDITGATFGQAQKVLKEAEQKQSITSLKLPFKGVR